jgi:hypothetical protein
LKTMKQRKKLFAEGEIRAKCPLKPQTLEHNKHPDTF